MQFNYFPLLKQAKELLNAKESTDIQLLDKINEAADNLQISYTLNHFSEARVSEVFKDLIKNPDTSEAVLTEIYE